MYMYHRLLNTFTQFYEEVCKVLKEKQIYFINLSLMLYE